VVNSWTVESPPEIYSFRRQPKTPPELEGGDSELEIRGERGRAFARLFRNSGQIVENPSFDACVGTWDLKFRDASDIGRIRPHENRAPQAPFALKERCCGIPAFDEANWIAASPGRVRIAQFDRMLRAGADVAPIDLRQPHKSRCQCCRSEAPEARPSRHLSLRAELDPKATDQNRQSSE
jgi:hypothetical protein